MDQLRRAEPVYETLPGWQTEITDVRQWQELPSEAVTYLDRIAELVGCPVEIVSVGPDREQTILRQSLAHAAGR